MVAFSLCSAVALLKNLQKNLKINSNKINKYNKDNKYILMIVQKGLMIIENDNTLIFSDTI